MGDIERLVADADDGTIDEEFLEHLFKGGELLSAGKLNEAREILEKAHELQPKNPKAQNLLGLTYFKLGIFDRAAEIYELLVRDNPVDPTLRLNLGLVYLKDNALERAIREFETAVDLAPDHKKAQNYLGVAYAQAGDHARAKNCFVAAGSLTMAEKMEQALKDPSKTPTPPSLVTPTELRAPSLAHQTNDAPIEAIPITGGKNHAHSELDVEIEVDSAPAPRESAEMPATPPKLWENGSEGDDGAEALPVAEPRSREAPRPAAIAQDVASSSVWVLPLSELTQSIAVAPASTDGSFQVTGETVAVRVKGELLTRLDGLLAAAGTLKYEPEMKRFRGQATDKAFGEGEARMIRVAGTGTLVLATKGRCFAAIELADESAYFREDVVFAFDESVIFENGRVTSKIAPDLHLVHLRGTGKLLLCTGAPLRSMAVGQETPCVVPLAILVGWHGQLTPKIVGIPKEAEGFATIPSVELTGEGFAILSGIKQTN
jgi:uncharacterized protein (AIM24 family)